MSDYVKSKVIRYPIDTELLEYYGIKEIEDSYDIYTTFVEKVSEKYPSFTDFPRKGEIGVNSTYNYKEDECRYYIDYVLSREYNVGCEDYGVSQELTQEQKEKWSKKFKEIIPNLNPDKFRLVLYCYYNGCDCPDYYETTNILITDEEE